MHLVGFIIRIYHDARSPERQIEKSGQFNAPIALSLGKRYLLHIERWAG